jgi:hypothetical protein
MFRRETPAMFALLDLAASPEFLFNGIWLTLDDCIAEGFRLIYIHDGLADPYCLPLGEEV